MIKFCFLTIQKLISKLTSLIIHVTAYSNKEPIVINFAVFGVDFVVVRCGFVAVNDFSGGLVVVEDVEGVNVLLYAVLWQMFGYGNCSDG